MVRSIIAVIVGMVVGMAANMALILLNMKLFPGPEGLEFNDTRAMRAYVDSLPQVAFLLPMVAHLSQALLGGWIAARLGASRPLLLAMVVALLTLIGGVMNMMSLPGPVWMWLEIPLYMVAGYVAGTTWQGGRF